MWGWGVVAVIVFIKGSYEAIFKKNSFGETPFLLLMGIFVWGDAVVLGLFWLLVAGICLILKDVILFLLIMAVFWGVRSLGEVIYWINQQFSTIIRNPPERLFGYKFLKNDSIWFIYQLYWQCVLVVSIVATIYMANLWFKNF